MTALEWRYVATAGPELRVGSRGPARCGPLVFVHGWPAGGAVWEDVVAALPRDVDVVVPDLPGFGGSAAWGPPSLSGATSALGHLLDHLDTSGAVLVGWSLGARVALAYTERFGIDRLGALVLVDSLPKSLPGEGWEYGVHTPFDSARFADLARRWRLDRRAVVDSQLRDVVAPAEALSRFSTDSLRATDHALAVLVDSADADLRGAMTSLSAPVLMVWGERSRNNLAGARAWTTGALRSSRSVTVADAGHHVVIERPEALADAIIAFALQQ